MKNLNIIVLGALKTLYTLGGEQKNKTTKQSLAKTMTKTNIYIADIRKNCVDSFNRQAVTKLQGNTYII